MRSPILSLAVVLASIPALIAQDAPEAAEKPTTLSSAPHVPVALRDAMQSRDFEAAVGLIDAALQEAEPAHPDYLLYLKGRALTELARYDEAVAAFTALETNHAESEWLSRARFGRADIFVRSRNYQAAGDIYRAEAQRLLSRERKDELASIYLEFADHYFDGVPSHDPAEKPQPDYAQALAYYQEAVKLGPTLPVRHRVEFRIARCQQELGNHGEAIAAYQRYVQQYAEDKVAPERRAGHLLETQARFQLGVVQLAAGQAADARKTWRDLLSRWPGVAGDLDPKVPELLAQAMYRLAHTYGIPSPASDMDLELGVAAAEHFIAAYPDHELTPHAELEIAQSYLARQRQPQAVARLQALIANPKYAESKDIPEARFLLGGAFAAQKEYDQAIAAWKDFLEQHPTDPKWADVQRTIVDTEFAIAAEQRSLQNFDEARRLWETFLNKYPLDGRAAEILFNFGRMQFEHAVELHAERVTAALDRGESEQSVELNDECRALFESAIADWRRLVSKYPQSNEASHAAFMIGVTLEDRLARLKEALEAYQRVAGNYQSQAAQRITGLTAPQLEVATERKFRTNETPRIKLTTRNVEKVTVKVYRIDMNDYFRKMHLATGVETLDIALIDPDEQFEHEVAEYQQYRRTEQDVDIPIQGAGVTAVTVSDEHREATTMVVVSDLDVIVKSSRNELFLFAQNMLTGQPVEGASVLISDGSEIFAETVTGENGVLQASYDELQSVADLRVFAIHEGHAASTVSNLNGLDFAVGLAPRGYLYTDRPVYRAGQLVNIKAIVRWVDQDRFTFRAGEKYKLDIYDARSRLIQTKDVALNEFGTVSDNLVLPESATLGSYRVHLHQPAGDQSYESSFEVLEYQLEPVQLTIDVERSVYYRGESVEGTISLKYYYGTPLADRMIQYRFGNEGWLTGQTDENGQVAFTFNTQAYNESQSLSISVQYPERGLGDAQTIFLATRGFDISVSMLRDVYINGETFDAVVKVADPAGKAVGTPLKLEVFEETLVRGQTGERLVATFEVESDKDTGEARHTLKLDDGGRYIVRATGTDRFANTVSGQEHVQISDDKDSVRLRILADKHQYRVGENAQVRLHWRNAPALALVTYEGASILGYRLVELQTGANTVEIPMASELAPNFNLAVAVMQQNQLHSAESEFRVTQKLNVVLEPAQTELEPGADLAVNIRVTDDQGRPVRAELSLGLVQSNLFSLFADSSELVNQFFGTGERTPSVRNATSCTFSYAPQTRDISRYLLAEAERLEILARESTALAGITASDEFAAYDMPESGAVDRMRRWSALNEDGRFGGGGFGGGELDAAVAEMQRKSGVQLQALNAAGDLADYERTLSLIIAQTERLDEKAGKRFYDLDGDGNVNGTIPAESYFKSSAELADFVNGDRGFAYGVNGITADGAFIALNGRAEAELAVLMDAGLQLLPGMQEAETAFWDPTIVTGEDGTATVTIKLPNRSTAWQLRSKGIDVASLAGQADVEIITKKPLFGELKLPVAFTDGDESQVLVEVHNALEGARAINVSLKATIGEKSTEINRTLDVQGPGIQELAFPVSIAGGENLQLELTVESGNDQRDAVARNVPIRPNGVPVYATAGGTASQSTLAFVEFGKNVPARDAVLEILIGPSLNRSLLDAVLGGGLYPVERCALPVSGIERSISDILGGVALLKMIDASRDSGTPESEALAARVAGAIAHLVASQREDGSWSWAGQANAGGPDRFLTSRAMWALADAREAGFAVEAATFNAAEQYLKTAFSQSRPTDREGQAILLHGLATCGGADFAAANRLHRERNNLSVAGLLHVALALAELDRAEMARDLLDLVHAKVPSDMSDAPALLQGNIPWMQDRSETLALYLLALEAVEPDHAKAAETAEALMKLRVGSRWAVEKANGPAIAALADWFARSRRTPEKYTLTVYVNDREADKFTIDPATDGSRRVDIPKDWLKADGPQRINFDLEGRGKFTYSAVLSGFVPAAEAKSTTDDWSVARRYEPAQRMLDGQPLPRGFSVLTGNYQPFVNPLTKLPLGERAEVTLFPRRRNVRNTPDELYDYLIVTEPIPAGCKVLTETIHGDFERYEMRGKEIVFYIGDKRYPGDIGYTMVGYLPGRSLAAPPVIRSFYRPALIGVAEPAALTVLARGETSDDKYRLTPDELYAYGERLLAKGDHASAHEHLSNLFGNWRLKEDVYRKTVEMLFRTSLATKSDGEIVKYFEIIKEKFADVQVSFEDILTVAASYREIGEYERSYLVYRSTVQGSFERESQTAGFLNERGEFVRSVQVMEGLLHDYPAESYIANATYGLAQEVYRKAPEAAADPKLRAVGLNRVTLIASAINMLEHFLVSWPKDPAADQASFATANALLDLEQFEPAIARCEQFAERYPDSRLIDSFWYIIGYSQFALNRHEEALETCRKVAEAKFDVPETGGTRDADNKWEAIYIMGQVYHSLGRPAEAITEYERVKERFSDASEAIKFFTRESIELDEVTAIKPADAKQFELRFRNIAEASIKVYRIDLMKFGLMQRNLDRITAINLAGIRPYHEETLALGDGNDYRDREQVVGLPLEEEGAYLVVCRGDNLYASGLVLVSPLALEVDEDSASGRVRVTVKDVTADKFAGEVHVKVIGSANENFASGETDLRGLFVADDIRGTSTVIAMLDDDRYAFYRGKVALQNQPNAPAPPGQGDGQAQQGSEPSQQAWDKDSTLRRNLFDSNSAIQRQNSDYYRQILDNNREGIQAEEAY